MPEISKFTGGFAGFSSISSSYQQAGGNDEAAEYVNSTMVFAQNTTPTGWTRLTTYDDHTLRITNGNITTSSSGSGFDSLMRTTINQTKFSVSGTASWTFGSTTITVPTSGSHTHPLTGITSPVIIYGPGPGLVGGWDYSPPLDASPVTFSGLSHSHPSTTSSVASVSMPGVNLNVQYRDCILARKD